MTYQKTRYGELGYTKLAPGMWTFVATDTGAQVGTMYRTKSEMLADLHRYATSWGIDTA